MYVLETVWALARDEVRVRLGDCWNTWFRAATIENNCG